jgi:hypothetical protein
VGEIRRRTMAKIANKLTKVDDNFTVNMYDNGFMVEVGGRDDEDNWARTKLTVATVEELIELIKEAASLPRSE